MSSERAGWGDERRDEGKEEEGEEEEEEVEEITLNETKDLNR